MGGSAWERQSRSDPSQNENIKQFYVKTENWWEGTMKQRKAWDK
jgi:hypothetical protein